MIRSLLLLVVAAGFGGCQKSSDSSESPQGGAESRWELVWSDEFEGTGLPDPTKWTYAVGGHGWANKEKESS